MVSAGAPAVLEPGAGIHAVIHAPGTCDTCDIYHRASRFVVRIDTGSGHGTGVVVGDGGLIATNAHVIGSEERVLVTLFDGTIHDARLLRRHPTVDLVLLQIESAGDMRFESASIELGDPPPVGTEVLVIGHPLGFDWTVSRGIVSALRNDAGGTHLIQTDASISPGNSGGPMLDEAGHLLGIVTSKVIGGGAGQIAFALPARALIELLLGE